MYRGYERLCRDVLGSGFRVFKGFKGSGVICV